MASIASDEKCLDEPTPRNSYLTALYKRSFAYHTVKNRLPVILSQTIDGLARDKNDIATRYGQEGQKDLKEVIGELSKLKYEIQTNKQLVPLQSNSEDAKYYNSYLSEQQEAKGGNVSYFNCIWLLAECYMYRRIKEAFELTNILKDFDPFMHQKQASYQQALPLITRLGQYVTELNAKKENAQQTDFITLLKLNLWGNKCDLSLSNGVLDPTNDQLFNIEIFEPNILCDHSEKIWNAIVDNSSKSTIIDIIFDNAGYELFTDLCLADYITSKNLTKKIRFYVKTIPWFISDVMTHDFNWTLDQLENNSNITLRNLGQRWKKYIKEGIWEIIADQFWTLPVDYSLMPKYSADLYRKLSEAKLAIFKGDLNYRKLFGERNWDPTTPVEVALQGFHPTKLCTLRTVKADIVCGLAAGVAEKTAKVNEKWMETGEYGLIQFSGIISPLCN